MAAMSVGGKSLGNLQCWKLHLSPNLQASFVSRNDAQYCCERPGGKKQFLVRNVYNGASKGCLGSICFTTITRLLLLSVIIIGEADIAITSFATIALLESWLVPPRRIPLTLWLVSDWWWWWGEKLTLPRESTGQKVAKEAGGRAKRLKLILNILPLHLLRRTETHLIIILKLNLLLSCYFVNFHIYCNGMLIWNV